MTSDYRRDHILSASHDEFERLTGPARTDIVAAIDAFAVLYPAPAASAGEKMALQRAFARYLIDSGKASSAGVLA